MFLTARQEWLLHYQSVVKGKSNVFEMRWNTFGYPEFTFEPKNLAISCKQCNTRKSTYDPLRDRSIARPLAKYPNARQIEWFHPHYQKYSEHIAIDKNFLFTAVSTGGERVIDVCGLKDSDVLEKKFLFRARTRAKQMQSVEDAVTYLVASVKAKTFSLTHAIQALEEHFVIARDEAQTLCKLYLKARTASDREKARAACLVIDRRLKRAKSSTINASRSLLGI